MVESLKSLTALVVDDEEEIRSAYQQTLATFFQTVHTAADGQEALALCRQKRIHALFVDYEMPRMDGYEFLQALREFDPEAIVTVISNHDNPKILQKFFPLKPCGYLFKPLRYRDFKEHMVLIARQIGIKAVYRLSDRHSVDFDQMQLFFDGERHTLTRLEADFLRVLYERQGRVVSFGAILEAIEQEEFSIGGIKNLVYRIKRKYGLDTISNIKGLGYKMQIPLA